MSSVERSDISLESSQPSQSKVRLEYLDGLRGLAALYVVWFHVYGDVFHNLSAAEIPYIVKTAISLLLDRGQAPVVIFIVLSGYCLMLPVARSENGQLKHGLLDYFKRRARRVLPPYYAALCLSLLLTGLIPAALLPATGPLWNFAQPSFTPGVLISHFSLVHNLNGDWIFSIDSPMWSVAVEWQIYFLFPLLLLPMWRRFGVISAITTACIVGFALHKSLNYYNYWYVLLFTIGMVGAVIGFSRKPFFLFWKEKLLWDLLFCLFFVSWTTTIQLSIKQEVQDLLLGIAVTCLIVSFTRCLTERKKTRLQGILHVLESRCAVRLGSFSYSLYLVHALVLALIQLSLSQFVFSPMEKFLILTILVLPLSLLSAYVFHLIFEKRFMNK